MRLMISALSLLLVPLGVQAQGFLEGTHFKRLAQVQPASGPKDKVEVLEAFSYACVHCAHFEPFVQAWLPRLSKQAYFVRLPVAWNPSYELYARGFLTAQALGAGEKAHTEMFRAVFSRNEQHKSVDDLAKFYSAYGIKPETFVVTANSFGITSKIKRIQQQTPRYEIDGTPTMVIAGKYTVTARPGATPEETLQIVDFLIQKELIEKRAVLPVAASAAPSRTVAPGKAVVPAKEGAPAKK